MWQRLDGVVGLTGAVVALCALAVGCGGTFGEPSIDSGPQDVWESTVFDPGNLGTDDVGDTGCLYDCVDESDEGTGDDPGTDSGEVCNSSLDEDGDGLVDCADPDCWLANGSCLEECDSGQDEDGDGTTGCDDSDCWYPGTACEESCGGFKDEDADGLVDCQDNDCWVDGGMCREICDSNDDEDGDGLVGCADPDCSRDLACDDTPVYDGQIQPILAAKCGPCHTVTAQGGTCFATIFSDLLAAARSCAGKSIAECLLPRYFDGSMPPMASCTGNPDLDAGKAGCFSGDEMDAIDRWVQNGAPQN